MDKLDTIKKRLLEELEKAKGNISIACKNSGVKSRQTFYKYLEDKDFRNEVKATQESIIDHVENKLFELIDQGNITAIIYFLKTKGKYRGYTEKLEIDKKNTSNNYIPNYKRDNMNFKI